ncbi:MAG: methyltransferase domain-containing protein [Acidimicrobiales bacterium]
MSDFDQLRQTWTELGDLDPLWAILSDPAKEGGRWDVAEFFRSGGVDLDRMLADLGRLGIDVTFGTALDFGCGVGRVTQAMARCFEESHGVDVAETMIEQADRFNQAPGTCRYHHNARPDLSLFDDGTFDFIYSMIVLQHMTPGLAKGYVREFFRVVKPDGVVVFQVPAERTLVPTRPGQTRAEGPLPVDGFRAGVDVVSPGWRLRRLPAGTERRITLRVTNRGDSTWPAVGTPDGKWWIAVANQWHADGQVVHQDDGRARIPFDLRPGESAKVRLPVRVPATPGPYALVLDVVQEDVCWFNERGSDVTKVPVAVIDNGRAAGPGPAADPKPVFEMHGVPRSEVEEAIDQSGGRLAAVRPDGSAGDAWVSWLYVATGGTGPEPAQE